LNRGLAKKLRGERRLPDLAFILLADEEGCPLHSTVEGGRDHEIVRAAFVEKKKKKKAQKSRFDPLLTLLSPSKVIQRHRSSAYKVMKL
jgi:hypothetical protein